jgi:hypothetical protein
MKPPSSNEAETPTEHEDLHTAKARLRTAAEEFDPLERVRKHPYALVFGAAITGAILGSSSPAEINRAVRKGSALSSSIGPILMAAGKMALKHFAAKHANGQAGASDADAQDIHS